MMGTFAYVLWQTGPSPTVIVLLHLMVKELSSRSLRTGDATTIELAAATRTRRANNVTLEFKIQARM